MLGACKRAGSPAARPRARWRKHHSAMLQLQQAGVAGKQQGKQAGGAGAGAAGRAGELACTACSTLRTLRSSAASAIAVASATVSCAPPKAAMSTCCSITATRCALPRSAATSERACELARACERACVLWGGFLSGGRIARGIGAARAAGLIGGGGGGRPLAGAAAAQQQQARLLQLVRALKLKRPRERRYHKVPGGAQGHHNRQHRCGATWRARGGRQDEGHSTVAAADVAAARSVGGGAAARDAGELLWWQRACGAHRWGSWWVGVVWWW